MREISLGLIIFLQYQACPLGKNATNAGVLKVVLPIFSVVPFLLFSFVRFDPWWLLVALLQNEITSSIKQADI